MDVSQMQYMPGDPRLVDQLVCELKSKGIFDQFRKECIADVDTRPAYQNLRQRVENSVSLFLSRQTWRPDLNKNQLREKLRKHILDGNYLEQGVERIVDQVVNPKVASIFIPQVEDLVYNYLGIPIKKTAPETSNGSNDNADLLPTDLEAVSPGSVKSSEETTEQDKMEIDEAKPDTEDVTVDVVDENKENIQMDKDPESQMSAVIDLTSRDSVQSMDKSTIPLPTEGIKLENIPLPTNSPPQVEIENIELPKDPYPITQIPLPDKIPPQSQNYSYFKPLLINSESDGSESDTSITRNMSPLTPVRNFDEDNSCDAKQGFDSNELVKKETSNDVPVNPSSFRFTIESSSDYKNGSAYKESPKKEDSLTKKFNNQFKINENTADEESSNSNNLHIDYESDSNNKNDVKLEIEQNSEDSKKGKVDEKKSHKSSYHSKDRHSSSKDRKYDSKQSSKDKKDSKSKDKGKSRDDSKSRDDNKPKSNKDSSSDRRDNKDRDSSKHRHSSSHRSSSSYKDSKSKSSSSSQKSSSRSDDKKSRDKSESKREHKSSSHLKSSKSDKDRKSSSSSSSKSKDDKKKDKKVDDHYSLSGRGNINRRSTDRDSNDGNSSSSKGFNNSSSKTTDNKGSKASSSKSDTPTNSDGTYPSDKDSIVEAKDAIQKPIRVDTHLETPLSISTPLKLPEMILKKPRIASNFKEAQEMVKMRKFLDEEQRRMNQEAALLLEFHANVRPNLSQVYSNISGPELEFACLKETSPNKIVLIEGETDADKQDTNAPETNKMIADFLNNTTNEDVEVMDNTDESQLGDDEDDDDLESHLKSYSISRNQPQNVKETVPLVKSDSKGSDKMIFELESKDGNKQIKSKETKNITLVKESPDEPDEIEILIPAHYCGVNDENNEAKTNKKQKESYFEVSLTCFGEQDKYNAEIEKDKFTKFFRNYKRTVDTKKKLFTANCSEYAIDLLKDLTKNSNDCEIVNYHKNGHCKDDKKEKPIKNKINTDTVLSITETKTTEAISIQKPDKDPKIDSHVLTKYQRPKLSSPTKSECSFELSSDYDAKLDELMHTTSRQQIMEIIFGGVISDETSELMHIDICNESNIEVERPVKRCFEEIADDVGFEIEEENVNNNTVVANKLRKTSESEEISSTTDTENANKSVNQMTIMKSKYLGKARRVGLPKPKRSNPSNSPSSDKSVENYEQNTTQANINLINCKIKSTIPRNKVQRYDTTDLYKPKLHYLSKRNNINTSS